MILETILETKVGGYKLSAEFQICVWDETHGIKVKRDLALGPVVAFTL